jgi:uncharacterized protein (TIGR00369 family)
MPEMSAVPPPSRNEDQILIRDFQSGKIAHAPIASSKLADALGGHISAIDADNHWIEVSYEPGEFFFQAEQIIQGGATATMLDFAMAFAALAVVPDGQSVTTVNLNIAYLRAAKAGKLRAIAEIERRGRSLIFTRAKLLQGDDLVVATGTSTLSVIASRP